MVVVEIITGRFDLFYFFCCCSLLQFLHVGSISTTLRKLCPSVGDNKKGIYGSISLLLIKWDLSGSGIKVKSMKLSIYLSFCSDLSNSQESKNIIFN